MRLTTSTVAAILAIALARAGAVPAPQSDPDGDLDFYHDVEGTDFQKRDPYEGGGAGGYGGGKGNGASHTGAYSNWPSKTGGGQGYQQTGAAGGGGMGEWGGNGKEGGNGGHGGKGANNGDGKNWGSNHHRRTDGETPSDTTSEDADPYAGVECNCFPDTEERDAVNEPTVRCGCFRPHAATDGSAADLDKRGKSGEFDIFSQWDWWNNQGTKDFDLTTGNPNLPYADWKFGKWANVGGLVRRAMAQRDVEKGHGGDPKGEARKYGVPDHAKPKGDAEGEA